MTTASPWAARATSTARPPALTSAASIARAQNYARSRGGSVSFAVLDSSGRLRGLNRTRRYPSASVVKAMLLVAALRSTGTGHLSGTLRAQLKPMIEVSDNEAAEAVFASVGRDGLRRVAQATGMRRFSIDGHLFDAQITAADQSRFFMRIDALVPAVHRHYARKLLSSITRGQRWGIAAVASQRGYKAFFKGGWRDGILHQAALLVAGGQRLALTVLTSGESMGYGEETLAGIARRVLRP